MLMVQKKSYETKLNYRVTDPFDRKYLPKSTIFIDNSIVYINTLGVVIAEFFTDHAQKLFLHIKTDLKYVKKTSSSWGVTSFRQNLLTTRHNIVNNTYDTYP